MSEKRNKLVIVVSRGTMDGLYPPLILATTGAAQGMEVHLYFTFGGMKLLTKSTADALDVSKDLGLSKEQLQDLLSKGKMPTVRQMLQSARQSGVKVHACSPTMGLFGATKEDLIPEYDDVIGASTFLELASDPETITLFV
jgi:peroxiredoxin family protein